MNFEQHCYSVLKARMKARCTPTLGVMHAEILRQNMQQGILGFLKINVELLLLFRVEIIEIKERAPGQTPPVL
jgi:hypothetical protein